MLTPGEHKTVQVRILAYAQEIGWSFVSREEAEQRRGGIPAPLIRKAGGWKNCQFTDTCNRVKNSYKALGESKGE